MSLDKEKSKYCIFTLILILKNASLQIDQIKEILQKSKTFIKNNYNDNRKECDELLRVSFEILNKNNMKSFGKKYFLEFKNLLTSLNFENIKAFILYFSYHLNDFNEIDEILNQIIIKTEFVDRNENLDFNLYCFYKGNIFLIKKNYNLAAFSYLCSLVHLLNSRENCIDDAQISIIKRLSLLNQIVDSEIKKMINEVFYQFSKLKMYNEVNKYIEIVIDNNDAEKNFENFFESRKNDFNKCKISGLAKIALNEYYLNKVKKQLKYYNRIKLTKLQKEVQIEFNKLINIIFYGIYNNKINVQYDEVEDILEIFNDGENINKELEEVKNCYSLLTKALTNIYLFDKNKVEEIQNFEKLSVEQKNQLLLKKHNKNEEIGIEDEMEGINEF